MPSHGVDIHGVFYKASSFQLKKWYLVAFVNNGSTIDIILDGITFHTGLNMNIVSYSLTNPMLSININNKGYDTLNNGSTNSNMIFGEIGVFDTLKTASELLDYKNNLITKFGNPL